MINRTKYFIGNWKMFGRPNYHKILEKIHRYVIQDKKLENTKIVACVPSTLLMLYSKKLRKSLIHIGAQNCSEFESDGPYTGSLSAKIIKDAGAKYVIIGHSESRQQGDTNNIIKKKINSANKLGLKVIFCFGETLNQKNKKKTKIAIRRQIQEAISNKNILKNTIFAYEPVWAIGTGKVPDVKNLNIIVDSIRKFIKSKYKVYAKVKILYGGSVDPSNIKKLKLINEIDGFLIGGASQSSKKFIDIVKNYYK